MGIFISKLFPGLFDTKELRILMLGLEGAGKSTILFKMKFGEVYLTVPTIGFNVETLQYKNINCTVWDVGGQETLRVYWKQFYQNTKELIYVVDSTDYERIEETRNELMHVLESDELRDAVLIVFANKQDMPNAMSVSEVTEKLELRNLINRQWYVQPTTAVTRDGL